ncbi:MAG: ankyrin repeat domain-containing protein, partial [Pseudomonadota bacterium]
GTDIDQSDASGRTALMIAAGRNHARYVQTLLTAGAALTLEDRDGLSAAHYAARGGHAPLLDGLLAAGMVRGRARLLNLAVASGDIDTVERVLALTGPDVHANGSPGALALAVTLDSGVLVERLLAAGADPLSRDGYGHTPLWHAIGRNDTGLIEKLAAAHAIADSDGNTPLHRAAILGDLGAIAVLTARGADLGAVNSSGETPLIAALKARQYGTLEALVNAGADVNYRNEAGQSALMIAAYRGDDTAVTTLLALGADPSLQSPDRRNAEDIADELGHTLVVAVLRQH